MQEVGPIENEVSEPAILISQAMQIPSVRSECEGVSREIAVAAGQLGYEPESIFELSLALDEALDNAVQHGNRNDPTKSIRIEYTLSPAIIRVSIQDEGQGFDPGGVPDPRNGKNHTTRSGRGIFLMRELMSGVRFTGSGGQVEMWKRRSDGMRLWPPGASERSTGQRRVLLAEDDDELRALLGQVLRGTGYNVITCGDGWSLFRHLASYFLFARYDECVQVDLVISDIRLPGPTGLQILKRGQDFEHFPPVILITAFGDEHTHADARRFGAAALFDKPFDIDDLLHAARKLVPPTGPQGAQ